MINEEQKQQHMAIRLRKIQEIGQADHYLQALTHPFSPAFILLKKQLQEASARSFDLDEYGKLEIYTLPKAVPSPLAFWQDETSIFILLWNRVLVLTIPQRKARADAASQAGLVLSRAETSVSQQPFLVYLVLALLALTDELPTPTQLQGIRQVADPAEGKISLMSEIVSMQEIRRIVTSGFAAQEETIPLPAGLWNVARGFVLTGLYAWRLKGDEAYHWSTIPVSARPHQDPSWNQRLQLSALAGMVATREHYARLSIPPAPGGTPEEIWLDYICLVSGTGTPDTHLRPEGLGSFGYSEIENNPDPMHLALSRAHGEALVSIAAAVLRESDKRPPRYIGRVLDLDLPLHLLPQLRPWGIHRIVIQVERDGMYVSVLDDMGRSMATAWWKASTSSAQRIPVTFTPASWILLHPFFSTVWHDLTIDGIVLEKPDLHTHGSGNPSTPVSKAKQHKGKHGKQKIYLPPVKIITKAQWGSPTDRAILQRATAGGHGYRRLPEGWEEREREALQHMQRSLKEVKPALLRRREEAIQRAIENRYPPPPPGFTYIAPYLRAGKPSEEAPSGLPTVRAKGLFSLVLGLQAGAIEPYQTNSEERMYL